MQQSKPYMLEKFAEGRFDVLAENGMRAGSIIGGHDQFAAEIGNRTIGRFTNKGKAAEAILEHAGITGIFDQMSMIAKTSPVVAEVHRRDLMTFDRSEIEAWKCATSSLWAIHRAGTSLIHLDLPQSRRHALAVLDAFTPGSNDSGWSLYLIDVNDLKVKPITESSARRLVSESPLFQLDGNEVRFAGVVVATLDMSEAVPASAGKCKVTIHCATPPADRRLTVLREIARQYYGINARDKYTGIESIHLRHGRAVRCLWRPTKSHH